MQVDACMRGLVEPERWYIRTRVLPVCSVILYTIDQEPAEAVAKIQ